MPGHVNYFYNYGTLPAHAIRSFQEYGLLTIHCIIVKNALSSQHLSAASHPSSSVVDVIC